ncbi:MAG: Crp/Fnr family transcriptional regulator [Bacteroidetes bacterium]|nr:Crp/Fnr family transcriptional regulator [Bacteroidota bacterium]MBS1757597.1 Crp/Fnr family transcriptional regulator [Bacteroidota bacterium]
MEYNNNKTDLLPAEELLQKLKEHAVQKNYKAGEVILKNNSYIRAIPFVISGIAKVMRTDEDGREILLYYLKAGESCIMSLAGGMQQEISKVKLIAEEDTELYFLPLEKISFFLKEYPQWLDYVLMLYNKRFEELLEVVNAVAFKKMDERLLNFIKYKCENTKSKTLNITHEQVANELGTARVVVSRLLKQMEIEGLVKLGRNKVTLL